MRNSFIVLTFCLLATIFFSIIYSKELMRGRVYVKADEEVVEDEVVSADIETPIIDMVGVSVPDIQEPQEPSYYIDIVDGFITEDSLASICKYVGAMYDIDPKILQAIAWIESRYKVNAVSKSNAKGICQIMEKWHKQRIDRLGVTDIYDPYSSVLLCADLISELSYNKYGDDIRFVLMAYNMGVSGATKSYEAGDISSYATNVMTKFYELEEGL